MKCKHKWVDMEDGSLDRICVKCRKFAMQAQMVMPASMSASASASMPMGREKIEVPFYNGSEHMRVEIYKDDLLKEMRKEQGLSIDHFKNAAR